MSNTKAADAKVGNVLTAALLKQGKVILNEWRNGKLYVELGIREKTALGTGTRAAMLAVAAHGYEPGKGRILAMAVRAAMGLEANVGGIDFPWLEKTANIRTITPLATVRQAPDGKMRLMVVKAKATGKGEAKASPKPTGNSAVRIVRESDKALAARDAAMADIAAELGNGGEA